MGVAGWADPRAMNPPPLAGRFPPAMGCHAWQSVDRDAAGARAKFGLAVDRILERPYHRDKKIRREWQGVLAQHGPTAGEGRAGEG